MAGPILANRQQFDWGSVALKPMNGQIELEGYSEISFSQKRTRSKGRGQGKHQAPQVRSSGEYDIENLKIKMRVDHANALRSASAGTGTSYGNDPFPITVLLVKGEVISTLEFFDCAIAEEAATFATGPDGLLEEVSFDCMAMRRDGLALFDDTDPNTPY
jgi:hypothetical protein